MTQALALTIRRRYHAPMTSVALQHRDKIIEQVAAGNLLDAVATSLHIAAPNISKHLATDPDYRQARLNPVRQIGAQLRLERAYSRLDQCAESAGAAADGNLVRAREAVWRASAWFAEREFPEAYGQRSTVQVEPVLMVHVVRVEPQVIPDESQRVDPATPQLPDSVK